VLCYRAALNLIVRRAEMSDTRRETPIERLRLRAFRVAAAILLLFAVLALLSVAVGAYFMLAEFDHSGWPGIVIIMVVGLATALLIVASWRALKVHSIEALEAQSRSRLLDRLGKWLGA
jgi:hypothetical protein